MNRINFTIFFVVLGLIGCDAASTRVITNLSVVNWYPSGSATCIPNDTQIWITFSTAIDEASLEKYSVALYNGNALVETTVTYKTDTATINIVPNYNLKFDTEYEVRLAPQLKSADGGNLGVELINTFRTVPQQGCAENLQCYIDDDCPNQICSVVGVCVDECVVPADCLDNLICISGRCQT